MTNRFAIGVSGLGLMGQRFLSWLGKHPSFNVPIGFDPKLDRCATVAASHTFEVAESEAALLEWPGLDAVYIASPPAAHIATARAAHARGLAVFLEKPLTTDLEEGRAWVTSLDEYGHSAAVNFPFATLPGLGRILRDRDDTSMGAIDRVEIVLHFSAWPRTWHRAGAWLAGPSEGGFLREVLSHFLFLTHRVVGPTALRTCHLDRDSSTGTERRVLAELDAGGKPVTLLGAVGGAAPDFCRWTLSGERRSYRSIDWGSVETSEGKGWTVLEPEAGESRGLDAQLGQLAAMLRGEPHRLATPREALAVAEVVETMLRG